ncbi:MAG: hypothetical protein K6L76_11410 [Agarilytica sp.]
MKQALYILLFISLIVISACGGGGGGGSSSGSGAGSTSTPTPTSAPGPLQTATPSPTISPTPSPTLSPTLSPSATPTPVSTATPSPSVTPTPEPTETPLPSTSPAVSISGVVTFDRVGHSANGGLNYSDISADPLRGATVQALDASDNVLDASSTDASGAYRLNVEPNAQVRIRVLAEMVKTGTPSWDIAVTDNTNGNALYVMQGDLANVGESDSERDLHAASGWTGFSYSEARTAAPFAILDAVYEAMQHVINADPDVALSPSELRWSVNNRAVSGSLTAGNIGTSFYSPSSDIMYILGDVNNDTDEYDKSVIQHEWAHYLEDTLSRSDSIGGAHSLGGAYDMRLALGEGFANAFSGIASGQPNYSDSAGLGQAWGFTFSMEENGIANPGWFNENSVGKIVYDIADAQDDGADTLSLGFSPIYQVMTSDSYRESTALTSIYLLAQGIKDISDSATASALDAMLQAEEIYGTGIYGEGETNASSQNASFLIPVYNSLGVGDTVNVCGNNREGLREWNGVDARRFVRINIASQGSYLIEASKTLGTGSKDPDIDVLSQGTRIAVLDSGNPNEESGSVNLSTGEYILEVYDYLNVDGQLGGGSSCFDVSISAL